MKIQKKVMGMTAVVEICEKKVVKKDLDGIFFYFEKVDKTFSTYKENSEIELFNKEKISLKDLSPEVLKIFKLANHTKKQTNGYFDILINGKIDPSGIVKGYAINEASKMLLKKGYKNFYIEIGSDFAINGLKNGEKWKVGIANPFEKGEIVKVLKVTNCGVATSGNYIRGNHIFNPFKVKKKSFVKSLTVIGPNVYDADRFATACFAMGEKGLLFLEKKKNFEGYMVTNDKKAYFTKGFDKYFTN
jgi:thiamine biosynthesis lipoprotein